MTSHVAVIGSINVDLFARVRSHPVPGETVLGTGGERAPGGKGANQALAARLQGASVSLVGGVGDDPDATTALRMLEAAGVDTTAVTTVADAPTGLAIITVSDAGENTIVVVSGANAAIPPRQVDAAVDRLAVDDLVLLQGELPADLTTATIRRVHARGLRVVLNLAPFIELPRDVLLVANPLVVNELEAAAVARQLGVDATSPRATADGLRAAGFPSVVITLGAQGCLVADVTGTETLPAVPVEAVDTTGAGDAFTGALVARLAAGDSLVEAARHATRVGAFAVRRPGAQPSYPTLQEELP